MNNSFISFVSVDETVYSEKSHRDLNYDSFFYKNFKQSLERTECKFLPFYLYKNYRFYIKCQILYFLYLNQHKQFNAKQIVLPIINYISNLTGTSKLWRKELAFFTNKILLRLTAEGTICSRKNNKTNHNEYFFNTYYEQLFHYDLFFNKNFIAKLESKKRLRIYNILKVVRLLNFIGNKEVTTRDISNTGLFGGMENLGAKFLTPLMKIGLISRKRRGNICYYSATCNVL